MYNLYYIICVYYTKRCECYVTFFETLNDVADKRRAAQRGAQRCIGYDAGTQGRAQTWNTAARATNAVVTTTRTAFDELVKLCVAEGRQSPDVRHVGVERTERHAHWTQFDVHATFGQIVRRGGQFAVVDDLQNNDDNHYTTYNIKYSVYG